MANNYKVKNFSNSTTNTSQVLFEASASTTLVKSIIVNCDKVTPNAVATLKIKKSGGAEELIRRVTVTSSNLSTELLYDVLPLESGDKLYATSDDTDLNFMMSWVENNNGIIGAALDSLTDVDTTGVANGDVLTYNSTSGNWEPEAPAAGGDIFKTIAVAGQSSIVADSTTDTLTIAAGTGITLTTDASTDTLTITNSATGANAFGNVAVAGQTTVAADGTNDTLTLVAGTGVTITTNATTDTVTITNSVTAPNTFGTIEVSGQSSVVADSTTDTLTLAAANTNVVITTNATTDTVTFGLGTDIVTGSVSVTGNLTAIGNVICDDIQAGGDVSVTGVISANSATLSTLNFTGGGTTTIGPNNALALDPADLEIRTNGNCDVVLDYDDNESSQAFRVKDGDGNVMFSVDEDGISVANGTSSTGAVLRLGEATANGSNYVAVQAPASLAADTTYTLPTADGTSGQVLSTNGSGTLSWATPSSPYSSVRTQSGTTYTLALTDAGDYIQTTSSTAVTITVPPQSSVTWAADTEIYFEQNNTGQITIAAGSGVTINSSETLKSFARYSVLALKRVASDVWTLTGERALV